MGIPIERRRIVALHFDTCGAIDYEFLLVLSLVPAEHDLALRRRSVRRRCTAAIGGRGSVGWWGSISGRSPCVGRGRRSGIWCGWSARIRRRRSGGRLCRWRRRSRTRSRTGGLQCLDGRSIQISSGRQVVLLLEFSQRTARQRTHYRVHRSHGAVQLSQTALDQQNPGRPSRNRSGGRPLGRRTCGWRSRQAGWRRGHSQRWRGRGWRQSRPRITAIQPGPAAIHIRRIVPAAIGPIPAGVTRPVIWITASEISSIVRRTPHISAPVDW